MNSLTMSLLELARAQTSELDRERTDMSRFLSGLPTMGQKRVTFSSTKARVTLWIYRDLFEIAVNNLVSNGLKYSDPETGRVRVQLEKRALVVSDNGVGIKPEDIDKVWRRFYKTDAARTYASGHGLGLSIVRTIIEKVHGMSIELESEIGKGTTITVRW